MGGEEFVSIAEAARRLGIQERQVRRYVARLADTDRTEDRTTTGRVRTLVRMPALRTLAEAAKGNGQGPDTRPDGDRTEDRTGDRGAGADQTDLVPLLQALLTERERVIEAKDQRIRAQDEEISYLRGALQTAQENVSREQALRAIAAPAQEASGEAEAPNTPPEAAEAPQEAAKAPQVNKDEPRRPWWRLWGGKGEA